jgi:hypothetical protein
VRAYDAFLEGTSPALGIALVVGSDPPLIILVVNDSMDDELVSVIAHATNAPADDFVGAWAARLYPAITVRFTLARLSGGFERQWTLDAVNHEIAKATSVQHLVAVLPDEIAGDLSRFTDLSRLGAAVIVSTSRSPALIAACA